MKHIESDPARCSGQYVLVGRRFTIAQLLAEVADHNTSAVTVAEDFGLNEDDCIGAMHECGTLLEDLRQQLDAAIVVIEAARSFIDYAGDCDCYKGAMLVEACAAYDQKHAQQATAATRAQEDKC